MKKNNSEINKYRVRSGFFGTNEFSGNNGLFFIPFESTNLKVLSSDGMGWDHVSVSLQNRTPNWKEMCFIKDLFFEPEETVIQFHPKKSEYVNNCGTCLHLWRRQDQEIELPPSFMVGIK